MKRYKDPVTGDDLTLGEYVSWKVQGLIRRWHFLIVVTIVTAFIWTNNNQTGLLWWNLGASYLAIVIESIVGISMYSQTRRDAVALREVRTISQNIEIILNTIKVAEDKELKELEELGKMMESKE